MKNIRDELPEEIISELADLTPGARKRVERLWPALRHTEEEPVAPSVDAAWDQLESSLSKQSDRPPLRLKRTRRPATWAPRRIGVLGGSMAIAAVFAMLIWWHQPITVVVPRGVQQQLELPDGSVARLNSESTIQYRREFSSWPFAPTGDREVDLEGEAFFDVVASSDVFVVTTFNSRIEVLGTRFNVRSRPGSTEDETRLTLESGRVRISLLSDDQPALLLDRPGASVRVRGGASLAAAPERLSDVPIEHLLAWQEKGFAAVGQPLEQIVAELERRFAISIDVGQGVAIDDSLTLLYPGRAAVEGILHDICLLQGCSYRRTSSGFDLMPFED